MFKHRKSIRYIYRFYHLEDDLLIFDGDYKFHDDMQAQDFAYEDYMQGVLVRIEKYEKNTGRYVGYCEIRI